MSQELIAYSRQLQEYAPHFDKVAPAHLRSDKLIRMAESAARITPYLLQCERGSLMRSIMTAAILGLECDGVTGQAYLLPFKGKVQLVVGYKGYVTLAFNSGYILEGRTVRAHDEFKFRYGLEPLLEHQFPSSTSSDEQRGDLVASYSVARHESHKLSSFRVCMMDQILRARDGSEGYKAFKAGKISTTPWVTNFDEMAKKTAIRAHADELPLNVQRAVAVEQAHDTTGRVANITPTGWIALDDEGEPY